MNLRNPITQELNELGLSSLAGADQNPYSVPSGYFEGLADQVLHRIRVSAIASVPPVELSVQEEIETLSPLLAGLSRKMPFSVPEGYFQSVSVPDVSEESVFLQSLPRHMPMQVPEGYFDSLPNILLSRVRPAAKVVPMFKKSWAKMAVAASIAGILTLGGIRYFNQREAITVDNPEWVSSKLQNIPDKALDEFVQTADVAGYARGQKTAEQSALLKDVSDKDLQAFLDQVPDEELGIN